MESKIKFMQLSNCQVSRIKQIIDSSQSVSHAVTSISRVALNVEFVSQIEIYYFKVYMLIADDTGLLY